jgi:hypothetical protein
MHALCNNCKSKLSCSCQKRTASNGAQVCNSCLATYEASLKNQTIPGKAVVTTLINKT